MRVQRETHCKPLLMLVAGELGPCQCDPHTVVEAAHSGSRQIMLGCIYPAGVARHFGKAPALAVQIDFGAIHTVLLKCEEVQGGTDLSEGIEG